MTGQVTGSRGFHLDEAEEYRDTVVCSERDRRAIDERIAQEQTRLSHVADKHYSTTRERFEDEIEFAHRVTTEGDKAVDETLADLRNGVISPKAAAQRIAEMRRDLNKGREDLKAVLDAEARTWEEVSGTAAAYQRRVASRASQLHAGGRGLLQLPTFD